jgi:hypothetical protein
MHQSLARYSAPVSSVHAPSWADFITTMVGFRVFGTHTGASNLPPVGLAVVVTTVANGLLSADLKARLVFCDRKYALPGHRAFSVYAKKNPRIDFVRLQRAL